VEKSGQGASPGLIFGLGLRGWAIVLLAVIVITILIIAKIRGKDASLGLVTWGRSIDWRIWAIVLAMIVAVLITALFSGLESGKIRQPWVERSLPLGPEA
jgi:hypothetical protein